MSMSLGRYRVDWTARSLMTFEKDGVGNEVVLMFLHGLALFCLLAYIDSGVVVKLMSRFDERSMMKDYEHDSGVDQEEKYVEDLYSRRYFKGVAMLARNVQKVYGSFQALGGTSLALAPQVRHSLSLFHGEMVWTSN